MLTSQLLKSEINIVDICEHNAACVKLLLTALSHPESIMKGALGNQGSYVVFLCVINGNCEELK